MKKEIIVQLHKNFEDIRKEKEGIEFWLARDLQKILGYIQWRNFENVVDKAKEACRNSKENIDNHFIDIERSLEAGKGAEKIVDDIVLTRYACYLIAQNGDSTKDEIAFAQSYFAIQTRKQELIEQRIQIDERLKTRKKLTLSEKEFSHIAFERGVDGQGFAVIKARGDKALFGGYNTSEMKQKLGVPNKRPLADFLPTITIKAKDLANEITNHNLKSNAGIRGEDMITGVHVRNNENMREMLNKSGIIPENLPPEEDVKKLERRVVSENKKAFKNLGKINKEKE